MQLEYFLKGLLNFWELFAAIFIGLSYVILKDESRRRNRKKGNC